MSFRDSKIFLDITSVFADTFALYLNDKQPYLLGISPKFKLKKEKVDQEKDHVPAWKHKSNHKTSLSLRACLTIKITTALHIYQAGLEEGRKMTESDRINSLS